MALLPYKSTIFRFLNLFMPMKINFVPILFLLAMACSPKTDKQDAAPQLSRQPHFRGLVCRSGRELFLARNTGFIPTYSARFEDQLQFRCFFIQRFGPLGKTRKDSRYCCHQMGKASHVGSFRYLRRMGNIFSFRRK